MRHGARRLQPHYIELAFKAAFTRLGSRIAKRECGRYEIANVPAQIRATKFQPIATRYDRVSFDLEHVHSEDQERADLLAPGIPLHDAVMDEAIRHFGGALNSGTVLVSATLAEPHLLVGVAEEVTDATGAAVSRRFGYSYVDSLGTVTPAGPAPYLDCVAAPDTPAVAAARQLPWPRGGRGPRHQLDHHHPTSRVLGRGTAATFRWVGQVPRTRRQKA
jgi:hypothetical protein